jgi:cation diffusion facilitator CzcD-associated flavoprotein CzcO
VLLSNDYYPALAAPNVRVVGSPIATADPAGLVTADGEKHQLDAIVLGTGFTATEFLAPMRVTGRAGTDLAYEWREGAQAYLGTVVPGFPNFFMLYGPNTNLGHNSMIFMLESQFRYVLLAVRHLAATEAGWLDVKRQRYTDYNTELRRRLGRTVWSFGCDSWYLTDAGRNTVQWPGTTVEFRRRLRRFDAADFTLPPGSSTGTRAAGRGAA